MTANASFIPYEQQASSRMCGAAALCMAYRSLGLDLRQADVWPGIVAKNAAGDLCAHTHLLAADALGRGLTAIVIEARDPWAMLQRCLKLRLRAILNHRSTLQAWTGHFSVLLGLDEQRVLLHDPQFGPSRMVPRDDLLQLWRPLPHPFGEITGNALVAVGRALTAASSCSECGAPIPEMLHCGHCFREVALRPAELLGCAEETCTGRTWVRVFCPHCDRELLGAARAESMAAGVGGSAPAASAMSLGEVMSRQQGLLAAIQETLPDGVQKDMVRDIGSQLATQHDSLVSALKTELAGSGDMLQAMQQQVAQLKEQAAAQAEAKKNPPPPASPPPRAALVPGLLPKVREKLLREFQFGKAPKSSPEPADLWEWLHSAETPAGRS